MDSDGFTVLSILDAEGSAIDLGLEDEDFIEVTTPTGVPATYSGIYKIYADGTSYTIPSLPYTSGGSALTSGYVINLVYGKAHLVSDYKVGGSSPIYIIEEFPKIYEDTVALYTALQAAKQGMTVGNEALLSTTALENHAVPTAPQFTSTTSVLPIFELIDPITVENTLSDLDINFSTIPAPPVLNLPEPPTLTANALDNWPAQAPIYFNTEMESLDWDDANSWITEEDPEIVQSRILEINAKISEFSARVQSETQAFNSSNTEFQAELQKSIQNAQLSQADDAQILQKYASEVQAETAKTANELQIYQQELSKVLQAYQLETGYDISKLVTTVDTDIKAFSAKLQQNTQAFQSELAAYQADLQGVSEENQRLLAVYNGELQLYGAEINKFTALFQEKSTHYQWYLSKYSLLKNEYISSFGVMQNQSAKKEVA